MTCLNAYSAYWDDFNDCAPLYISILNIIEDFIEHMSTLKSEAKIETSKGTRFKLF